MARQLLLTLALEKMGKPTTTSNGELVIQGWLKQNGLVFPGLVIENGSGPDCLVTKQSLMGR